MKVEQIKLQNGQWAPNNLEDLNDEADLVLVFGGTELLKKGEHLSKIKGYFSKAHISGCSTAGEIFETEVVDDSLSLMAIKFEKSKIVPIKEAVKNAEESFDVGKRLTDQLDKKGLVSVFILSDGLNVNGSELVRGLRENLDESVVITGGLSGDGARFEETYVIWDDKIETHCVTAIGLYGDHLKVGFGSLGGWDVFGMEKTVTKSKGNVLYELDGKSALEIYKQYLGDMAKDLPASGLLFPLDIQIEGQTEPIVRTILAVDEKEQSLTFAGDIPEGAKARLMKANFNRLVDGAVGAAKSCTSVAGTDPDFAVLISCVGRKLILKQRIEEEVEGVKDVLGEKPLLTGFYSYGEISPQNSNAKCELHNQTMTITTFKEE